MENGKLRINFTQADLEKMMDEAVSLEDGQIEVFLWTIEDDLTVSITVGDDEE